MSDNNDISKLFELMSNHIKDLGFNRVLKIYTALNEAKKVNHIEVITTYILAIVSNYYAISIDNLQKGNTRECTEAKKIAMYLLKYENLSISWIANRFNNFSNGTTHRHISDVEGWLGEPQKFPDIVDKIQLLKIQLEKFKEVIKNQYYN